MVSQIKAKDIEKLLHNKHGEDIFIPQCKTGPSYGANDGTLDAWVMPKSWANMNCVGYEIKVNRGDFLRDDKWKRYLPYCNSFYFVCPTNLIQADELPPEVGLMWTSQTGKRLYTKKKAPFRTLEIPSEIFCYILMWRIKGLKGEESQEDKKDTLRDFVRHKKWNNAWGHAFGKRLSTVIENEISKVKNENESLLRRIESAEKVEKMLEECGMNSPYFYTHGSYGKDLLQRDIEEIQRPFKGKLDYILDRTIDSLMEVRKIVNPKYKETE